MNYKRKRVSGQGFIFSIVLLLYGLLITGCCKPHETMEALATEDISTTEDMLTTENLSEKEENSDDFREEPTADIKQLEVHFLDMGQADCTFLRCGDETMVIDAGQNDSGTKIQLYLTKQGVEKIDWLILTHPDADHIGGADVLITKFDIGTVYMSDFTKDNRTYEDVINALEAKNLGWSTPAPGIRFALGSAEVTILGPVKKYDDSNNGSIIVLVRNGEDSFLFTGDAEEEAERDLLEYYSKEAQEQSGLSLAADVFQAGHHGSQTSNSQAFLEAVSPAVVVISCGEGNSYGHPHAGILNTLREMGIQVYRTDEQGTVVATTAGDGITFNMSPSDSWIPGEPKKSDE